MKKTVLLSTVSGSEGFGIVLLNSANDVQKKVSNLLSKSRKYIRGHDSSF